jgi:hypothetical protein
MVGAMIDLNSMTAEQKIHHFNVCFTKSNHWQDMMKHRSNMWLLLNKVPDFKREEIIRKYQMRVGVSKFVSQ